MKPAPLFAILAASLAPGLASAACPSQNAIVGLIHAESGALQDGTCSVSISPNDAGNLVFRSYLFDDDGELMVFDSVDGPENTSAGARSYFLFPRSQAVTLSVEGGEAAVSSASGVVFHFSAQSAHLASADGVLFQEDPTISMSNQGGLDIQSAPGLLLDTGWKVGGEAFVNPDGQSAFRDPAGKTCLVGNREVFDYPAATFKFAKDAELADFLATRCPSLDLSGLSGG